MNTFKKLSLFWILILAILATGALVAFVLDRSAQHESSLKAEEYKERIRMLNDTVQELRKDIEHYENEIARISIEKDSIRKEITRILTDNEEIDQRIANGSVDDNIRFITKYLSKGDYPWERHGCGTHKGPADNSEQVIE